MGYCGENSGISLPAMSYALSPDHTFLTMGYCGKNSCISLPAIHQTMPS
uniref:Uncharacterized protein n=1 Tax=Arundo donax TaxID=35708 RepID=A0A0A9BXP4_ARUDO